MGKTSVLRRIQAQGQGTLLNARNFLCLLRTRQPAALEETFFDLIEQALKSHELVIIDDLHLITNVVEAYEYPRSHLLNAVLTALATEAETQGKKLIFSFEGNNAPAAIQIRAFGCKIEEFAFEDYEFICRYYLNPQIADRLDYAKIHRFAPSLNGYQLKNSSILIQRKIDVDTGAFIDYLQSQNMASNVNVEEVETVDWKDLKGLDHIIKELETKIALPFENDELATRLKLKPKRGVVLAGPPGTGKTTIGRALAHRLKSKFFLIDGTVVAGLGNFYVKVEKIFEAAKRNAPSIVFIDDADVIFENGEHGFYRYLLTMMDGLESASAQRVCVMITAMDVSVLPPAMLRSGRIELWLETGLPDDQAREAILSERLLDLPLPISAVDIAAVAKASRGLTGADLKAVVEDAKLLFAYDQANGTAELSTVEYFFKAIEKLRTNHRTYGKRKSTTFGGTQFGFSGMAETSAN
jgi:transitional endoplasmic reticulum ATPase